MKAFAGSRCIDTVMPANSPNEAVRKSHSERSWHQSAGKRRWGPSGKSCARNPRVIMSVPSAHEAPPMDRLRGASTTSSFFGVGIGVSVILSIAAFPLFVPAAASSRKWSGLSAIPPSRFDERFS